jgi:hypothetical protein
MRGSEGSVAQVMLRSGAVKRLPDEVEEVEKPIVEARAEGYRYLDFATDTAGVDYRVSLHAQDDLVPKWLVVEEK